MSLIPLKPAAAIAVLTAVGAAGVGVATLAGGGGDLPSDAVAKVGDTVIKRSAFDNWLRASARGQVGQVAPDPPSFERCVAAKRKQPRAEGAAPGTDELRRQCRQEYGQLRDGVLKALIEAEWVRQEAEVQRVDVSEAEVKRSFEDQKEQAFPSKKAYTQFIKSSGMSEEDILLRVELDMLEHGLIQNATKGGSKATVSSSEVREYYDNNKGQFGRQSFRQAKQSIRNLIRAEREQKAFATFMTEFRREYRGTTTCADGFKVDVCKNGS
jgi:foldase protein PrsA